VRLYRLCLLPLPILGVGALRLATAVPSTPTSSRACLHTTPVLQESISKRKAREKREHNKALRVEREERERTHAPHPALGHRPGEEHVWTGCDLARIIITPADAAAAPKRTHTVLGREVEVPTMPAHGVGIGEQALLFRHLPVATADIRLAAVTKQTGTMGKDFQTMYDGYLDAAVRGANTVASIVDLRNASAGGIAFVNRRRIVELFSKYPEAPNPAQPEVQGACAYIFVLA
jgi:small subunit ribosomal protein S15